MERIADLKLAEDLILQEVRQLVLAAKNVMAREPTSPAEGINILNNLRKTIYEDLNQIQHEAIILRAAQSLKNKDLQGEKVELYWNPRQTGTAEEPDLQAVVAGRIAVSAEITASDRPIGTIAKRMNATLQKLSRMPGKRIYFVSTEAMEKQARTKVRNAGYQIEVRRV